jgi:hypothetical protein
MELVRIASLKADILETTLAFNNISFPLIDSILKKSDKWYGRLPKELHILNLSHDDVEINTRASIYHVHLFYLGGLYYVISPANVSRFEDWPFKQRTKWYIVKSNGEICKCYGEGYSTRIINLLMLERGYLQKVLASGVSDLLLSIVEWSTKLL